MEPPTLAELIAEAEAEFTRLRVKMDEMNAALAKLRAQREELASLRKASTEALDKASRFFLEASMNGGLGRYRVRK
jgi:hypothetical protein